jgi:hypothetical protein
MHDNSSENIDLAKLGALLLDHGERWTITPNGTKWEAVTRPTPRQVVVRVAPDLDQLRTELEAEL